MILSQERSTSLERGAFDNHPRKGVTTNLASTHPHIHPSDTLQAFFSAHCFGLVAMIFDYGLFYLTRGV